MGIIKKLFTRNLTPEEQAEKSRREKEWAEKCYTRGEEFAAKIKLDKHVSRVNDFANTYPRTFFGGIIVVLVGCIILNHFIAVYNPADGMKQTVTELQSDPLVGQREGAQNVILQKTLEMTAQLDKLDKRITALYAKPSLTREDSLELRDLLLQANALQQIILGTQPSDTVLAAPAQGGGAPADIVEP